MIYPSGVWLWGRGHSHFRSVLSLPHGSDLSCNPSGKKQGNTYLHQRVHVPGGHCWERPCRAKGPCPQGLWLVFAVITGPSRSPHHHHHCNSKTGTVGCSGQMILKLVACQAFAQAVSPAWTPFPLFCWAKPQIFPCPQVTTLSSAHPTMQVRGVWPRPP